MSNLESKTAPLLRKHMILKCSDTMNIQYILRSTRFAKMGGVRQAGLLSRNGGPVEIGNEYSFVN